MNEKIIPSKKQLEFLSWEFGVFMHFGIRTFYPGHSDWDNNEQAMTPDGFNPQDLDCEQWAKSIKEAGATYAILTAKHHDGFANWPSKYTDYSVAATPWKDGKGDVVGDFVAACRKYGLHIGIYYSPADARNRHKTAKEYDDYFIAQIGELLTSYGKIDYLWFDGNGSEGHEYDKERIIAAIRGMQPDILIFNMWDADTRWIGNEAGLAPNPNYNVVSDLPYSVQAEKRDDLGENVFLPGECDFKMRDTWFISEDNSASVKTVDELMGIYDHSVGRGANFLINVAPDSTGHLAEPDNTVLKEFGEALRKRFANPVAQLEDYVLPDEREANVPEGEVHLFEMDECHPINCVVIEEDLTEGENALQYEILVIPPYSSDLISVFSGYQIGHKAICNFPTALTKRIYLRVLKKNNTVKIKNLKAYYNKIY